MTLIDILLLLTAVAALVVAILIYTQKKRLSVQHTQLEADMLRAQTELTTTRQQTADLTARCNELEHTKQQNNVELARADERYAALQREVEAQLRLNAQAKHEYATLQAERDQLKTLYDTCHKELDMLKRQVEHDNQEREQRLNEQMKLVKEQMQNAATELLRRQSEGLNDNNKEQMSLIIGPLKEQIKQMGDAMEANKQQNIASTSMWREKFADMIKSTQQLGNKADNLAEALRGRQGTIKMQGNWGEDVLRMLLADAGFVEGIHYDYQYTIKDEGGNIVTNTDSNRRMIPDIVLHYPDKKDVIIDSKVSLKAYTDYYEASDDTQRAVALDLHVKSLRNHVKELSQKRYHRHMSNDHQQLDFTVMFVPVDAALNLALQSDPTLWHDAFETDSVYICSAMMLVPLLRMIQQAWRYDKQTRQQEKIFEEASKLVEKIQLFAERYADVGKRIDALQNAYNDCDKTLQSGKGNLLRTATNLVEYGAKQDPKRPLPLTANSNE